MTIEKNLSDVQQKYADQFQEDVVKSFQTGYGITPDTQR